MANNITMSVTVAGVTVAATGPESDPGALAARLADAIDHLAEEKDLDRLADRVLFIHRMHDPKVREMRQLVAGV